MPRVLVLATTTGYQVRAFGEAAERMGVDLVYATDRCEILADPWMDGAVPVRFYDEEASAAAILEASRSTPINGVVAVGDRPTVIAALVLQRLGLPGHFPEAAMAARNKLTTRERLRDGGLPVPRFMTVPVALPVEPIRTPEIPIDFPVVVKPLALSGSRGVMRANDQSELGAALFRLRSLMRSPDIRSERYDAHELALIEEFIEGPEVAVEGLLEHGQLRVLAIFDKPDPLDGPFFEETIYITPSSSNPAVQHLIVEGVAKAAAAIGLWHGPIHAECRVNPRGVYVLEVGARPIGGLCARALRFRNSSNSTSQFLSLEELLLRHALGGTVASWEREPLAAGVLMIPIPRRGVLRRVSGIDQARQVPDVEDVRITAKIDQLLVPLPEGASYLGFIFARGESPGAVERALRAAHDRLEFTIDPEVRVLQSFHG